MSELMTVAHSVPRLRNRRLGVALCVAVSVCACGGTTGREGLAMPGAGDDEDSGADSSVAALPDTDAGDFDVTITYADRVLPDISVPPEVSVTGPEAGAEAGGLVPCTTAGQTGCVSCPHNANTESPGLCTPTEAMLVQYDIGQGLAKAPGDDPAGSCYTCLNQAFVLDDDTGDVGDECEDPITGAGTPEDCHAVLACILYSGNGTPGSSCAGSVVNNCYCGPAAPGSGCTMAGAGVNGVCAGPIATGLGFPISDNTDILLNLEDQTRATGIATSLFQGAILNHCPCLN